MFLKLLLPLGISFYFNSVFSFSTLDELYSSYENIISGDRTDICQNLNHQFNISLCRSILSLLRKDAAVQNPYRNSLYMHYSVYRLNIPICETKKVIIPAGLSKFGRTSVNQTAMNCFGRSLIISESGETPLEDYQYFKEISINYGTDNSVFVFQCQKNTCVVLEHYQYAKWSPELIFIFLSVYENPVPVVEKDEINLESPVQRTLLTMWMNTNNVLYSIKKNNVKQFCSALFDRPPYTDEISKLILVHEEFLNSDISYSQLQKLPIPVIDESQLMIVDVYAFTCYYSEVEGLVVPHLSIMAGPDNHSVFLLKRDKFDAVYSLMELISNLYTYNTVLRDTVY